MYKRLSVFIDESGDFGPYKNHSPYYIVTMILHDQKIDITDNIKSLDSNLNLFSYFYDAVHTGPIIRKEEIYKDMMMEERKRIFHALFHFARKLNFKYISTFINKKDCSDIVSMTTRLSKNISSIINDNLDFLKSFDEIVVYYDNGQIELTKIITSIFHTIFNNVDFRKVKPVEYKLFQVADLICSLELLNLKGVSNSFSKSEKEFFGSYRDFKKNYFKYIIKKKI